MRMGIRIHIVMNSFFKLLQSVDAFFPVGAFTLSNGLEDYVLRDVIRNEDDLRCYLDGFLNIFPYNDLGLIALAYQHANDYQQLLQLDQIAGAMKSAKEIRIGSSRMCSRYIKARTEIGDMTEGLIWYKKEIDAKRALGFHPIALGIYASELDFPLQELLMMYGYSVISAVVNNAVKLVPLSQLSGQKILFEQMEKLQEAKDTAMQMIPEMLGVSGAAYEIHCMNHEHLYSRQYMS